MNPILLIGAAGVALWALVVASKKSGSGPSSNEPYKQGDDTDLYVPISDSGQVILTPGNMGTVYDEHAGSELCLLSSSGFITKVESNNPTMIQPWNGKAQKLSMLINTRGIATLIITWGGSKSTLRVVRDSAGATEP